MLRPDIDSKRLYDLREKQSYVIKKRIDRRSFGLD